MIRHRLGKTRFRQARNYCTIQYARESAHSSLAAVCMTMSSSHAKPGNTLSDEVTADPASPRGDARIPPAEDAAALSGEVTCNLPDGGLQEGAGKTEPPAAGLTAGTIIGGRYRVGERIGHGGFGEVYAAENLTLHTRVAIKVLYSSFDAMDLEQFLQETKISSLIHHPNVVYVIDSGQLPDLRPYLVMEFLEGETLDALIIRHKKIPPLRAAQIALQIVHGLAAIHKKSIAHLDLKPKNVMLVHQATDGDFVKILDFGIAQFVRSDSTSGRQRSTDKGTEEPIIVGTPAYMSPEQILGQPPTKQSDQYSLGCIFFRMLTGALPFIGVSADDVMLERLYREPPHVIRATPDAGIPVAIDEIVHKCMQSDPLQRYPSLAALAEVLEQVVQDMQAAAYRNTQPVQSNEHPDSQVVAQKQKHHSIYHLGWIIPAFLSVVLTVWIYFKDKGKRAHDDMLHIKQARVEALRVLTELTDNPNVDIRVNALSALSDSHDPAIQPALRKHLGDSDPGVRVAAASALAQFAENDSVTALRALMQQHVNTKVTMSAARALMQLGDRAGERELLAALGGADQESQIWAVLALCGKRWPDATDLMRRYVAAAQPADMVGIEMLGCLASTGDASARDQLRGRTSEGLPGKVRIAAAARLLRSGDPLGAQLLLELSKKPAFEQLIAARALASPQYPETVALFRDLLKRTDAEPASLQLAVEGIGEAGSSEHVTLLHPLLRSAKDDPLRLAAASAIIHIAGRDPALVSAQALAWAKQALSSSDEAVRLTALDVLAVIQNEDSSVTLASLLHDPSIRVRQRAVRSLGRQSGFTSAELLRTALTDSDPAVRIDAVQAIGALARRFADTAPELTKRMLGWLRDFLLTAQSQQEKVVVRGTLLASGDTTQKAQLVGMLSGSAPELRALLLSQLAKDADSLAKYLSDPDARVRFEAAKHLAEMDDLRAIPILQDALKKEGPESLLAHGLLQRISPQRSTMDRVLTQAHDGTVEQRVQLAQLGEFLPDADAQELLRALLGDGNPLVRSAALTVLGARKQPLPLQADLLDMLVSDPDPALRHRAQLMRQAVLQTKASVSKSKPEAGSASSSQPKSGPAESLTQHHPDTTAVNPESGSERKTGQLFLKSSRSTLCSVDKGSWQPCDGKSVSLVPGIHSVATLDGNQSVTIVAGQTTQIELPESRAEQYSRTGLDLLKRGDVRKAQKLLERVEASCSAKVQHVCQSLILDVQIALGESYEAQGRLSDAMVAFQKAAARLHSPGGAPTDSKAGKTIKVDAAVARLAPRLGQVVIRVKKTDQCHREVRWLPPGTHEVVIGGRPQQVTVRAQQTVEVGECS